MKKEVKITEKNVKDLKVGDIVKFHNGYCWDTSALTEFELSREFVLTGNGNEQCNFIPNRLQKPMYLILNEKIKVMEKLDLNSRKIKKELLKKPGTLFTIEGLNCYRFKKDFEENYKSEGEREYDYFPKLIETNIHINEGIGNLHSIQPFESFGESMNISKFGPTCIWLFSYDLVDNKTTSKINYDKITILSYKSE